MFFIAEGVMIVKIFVLAGVVSFFSGVVKFFSGVGMALVEIKREILVATWLSVVVS